MRFAIPFVLLFAGVAPANDADARCRQAKAALALASAKGAIVAPMPREQVATKPACSTCSSCECAQGFCPQACPSATPPKTLTTTTGRLLTWTGTVYVYADAAIYPNAHTPTVIYPAGSFGNYSTAPGR